MIWFIYREGRWFQDIGPDFRPLARPASAAKALGSPRLALALLGAVAFAQALAIFYLLEARCR